MQKWAGSFTYNVTALAVALLLECVERLPSKPRVTGDAGEALHVEHLLHGDAAAAVANHIVPTAGAATCSCAAQVHMVQLIIFDQSSSYLLLLLPK